jgi:hypothetical protein
MNREDIGLPPHLQRMINLGVDGADIMHGELKVLMLEAEKQLEIAQQAEDESEEAMDSMERKYWEGVLDTYGELYGLTYDIAFAKTEKDKQDMLAALSKRRYNEA